MDAVSAVGADEPLADACVICGVRMFDDLDAVGLLAQLDCCDHRFCCDCVFPWLTLRSSTYPVCRRVVSALSVVERGG